MRADEFIGLAFWNRLYFVGLGYFMGLGYFSQKDAAWFQVGAPNDQTATFVRIELFTVYAVVRLIVLRRRR